MVAYLALRKFPARGGKTKPKREEARFNLFTMVAMGMRTWVGNVPALQAEMEFESELRSLLAEYGYSLRDVISLLDPNAATRGKSAPLSAPAEKGTRKARELKVYKNPHSGEIVETKGGNHKLLKAWKNEHGADVVESLENCIPLDHPLALPLTNHLHST